MFLVRTGFVLVEKPRQLLKPQMGFVKEADSSLSGWQRSDWLLPK